MFVNVALAFENEPHESGNGASVCEEVHEFETSALAYETEALALQNEACLHVDWCHACEIETPVCENAFGVFLFDYAEC